MRERKREKKENKKETVKKDRETEKEEIERGERQKLRGINSIETGRER